MHQLKALVEDTQGMRLRAGIPCESLAALWSGNRIALILFPARVLTREAKCSR